MTDTTTPISTLIRAVEQFRHDRDWAQHHSPRNLAMSICIEAAELLEIFQWRNYETWRLLWQQRKYGV